MFKTFLKRLGFYIVWCLAILGLLIVLLVFLTSCNRPPVAASTPEMPMPTVHNTTETATPDATFEAMMPPVAPTKTPAPKSSSNCLPTGYDWKTEKTSDVLLPFPQDEQVRVYIANNDPEASSLELQPGEIWLRVLAPESEEAGVILLDGEVFHLRRAEPAANVAVGYAITVCGGAIYFAPLPDTTVPEIQPPIIEPQEKILG